MIKIEEIKQAMLLLKVPSAKHVSTAETLAFILDLCQDRGEYDDTIESAIECLEREGYVVEGRIKPTVVVFRVFKGEGDVIALFPEVANDLNDCCESYQHVGQHGAADYVYCIKISRPATAKEYAPLVKELEGIGYVLDIRTRAPAIK